MDTQHVVLVACGTLVVLPVVLCGGTGLYGTTLDSHVDLSQTYEASASAEDLFDLMDDMSGLERWWTVAMEQYAKDNDAEMPPVDIQRHQGSPDGVGLAFDFVLGGTVTETWVVRDLHSPKRAVYDVDFKIFQVVRTIELTPLETGTHISWRETADIANPWLRLITLMMGPDEAEANFLGAMKGMDNAAQQ